MQLELLPSPPQSPERPRVWERLSAEHRALLIRALARLMRKAVHAEPRGTLMSDKVTASRPWNRWNGIVNPQIGTQSGTWKLTAFSTRSREVMANCIFRDEPC